MSNLRGGPTSHGRGSRGHSSAHVAAFRIGFAGQQQLRVDRADGSFGVRAGFAYKVSNAARHSLWKGRDPNRYTSTWSMLSMKYLNSISSSWPSVATWSR